MSSVQYTLLLVMLGMTRSRQHKRTVLLGLNTDRGGFSMWQHSTAQTAGWGNEDVLLPTEQLVSRPLSNQ